MTTKFYQTLPFCSDAEREVYLVRATTFITNTVHGKYSKDEGSSIMAIADYLAFMDGKRFS